MESKEHPDGSYDVRVFVRNCRHVSSASWGRRCQSFRAIMRSTVATKEWTLVIICSDSLLQTSRGWASRGAVILQVSADPSSSTQMFVGISGIQPITWPHRGADFTAALCISYIRMRRAMCAPPPLPVSLYRHSPLPIMADPMTRRGCRVTRLTTVIISTTISTQPPHTWMLQQQYQWLIIIIR